MVSKFLLASLIVITLLRIVLSITSFGCSGCANPIESWLVGFYFIVLFALLAYPAFQVYARMCPALKVLLRLFYMEFIFFIPIWNVLGTIWIFKLITNKDECLTQVSLIICLLGQIVIYAFYIYALQLGYSYVKSYFSQSSSEMALADRLIRLYEPPSDLQPNEIEQFFQKNQTLIDKVQLLDIEKELIKKHFTRRLTNSKANSECSICLENLSSSRLVSSMSCQHEFHYNCLIEWFSVKPSCPLCRASFRKALIARVYQSTDFDHLTCDFA
jgi:hypothetical protein